jgi:hypothetical protein
MTIITIGDRRALLEARLETVRERTHRMIDPLDEDDLERQHQSIMSPLVWDVGHVGNFEELWLLRVLESRRPHDERLDRVYNPFENPRWCRGDLDLLHRRQALDYLREVRGEALAILRRRPFDPEDPLMRNGYVFDMVVQHEVQRRNGGRPAGSDSRNRTNGPPHLPCRRGTHSGTITSAAPTKAHGAPSRKGAWSPV